MKTNIYKYLILKKLPTKIKNYTVKSSPNIQLLSTLFCPYLLNTLQICSTHSKFAPPTPNLLHPLFFRCLVHDVSTLYQYKTKTHKTTFLPKANKYCLQIFSTSTPLAHSPHPHSFAWSFSTSLHPLYVDPGFQKGEGGA